MDEPVPSQLIARPVGPAREGVVVPQWPIASEGGVQGLQDYGWLLRKHLCLIALCLLGTLFAIVLTIVMTTPVYTAETTLLIEPKTPQVLDFREVLTGGEGSGSYDFYKTQREILKSQSLAAQVIRKQQLETDDAFTGRGRDDGLLDRLLAQPQGWVMAAKRWVSGFFRPSPHSSGESPHSSDDNPPDVSPELINAYLSMLNIQSVEGTQLVKIAFNTADPVLSARLANAHAQAYIRQGLERRSQASEEVQDFLEGKLVELKARVEQSEAALSRYRQDKGIISLDDKENIVVERLADLNKRLTEAEVERIGLESQVQLIRKGRYGLLPAVINNSLIQGLIGQVARLEGEYTRLAALYKPGHPTLDQFKAQMDETQHRLREEIQRVVEGLRLAYRTAETKEKQLRSKMGEQRAAALRLKDVAVEYAILAREVDTNRQLYNSVLQRVKETGMVAGVHYSNVFVIDKAKPPWAPSKPVVNKSLLLGTFLGLMGGVGLAFLREHLDNTLKTPEEAKRYLGLPDLGMVPDFLSLDWRRHASQLLPRTIARIPNNLPTDTIPRLALAPLLVITAAYRALRTAILLLRAETPPQTILFTSLVVTEAYRTLRTAILLLRAETPPQTILFTSASHREGKTTTVVNTAIAFAQMGVKVLVVDADLRRSRCHALLNAQKGPGLTEILTGLRNPQELIQPTHTAGLFLLSGGSTPPNPADLVGSKKMQQMLAILQPQYDYILIDSPPVLSISDAVLLSTIVEGVILVVAVQDTPKQLLKEACARLSYARAKMLGAVFNRVDVRKGAYAYYYRPYDEDNRDAETETSRIS
jgi:polysaccharide biosynthesis transport protein